MKRANRRIRSEMFNLDLGQFKITITLVSLIYVDAIFPLLLNLSLLFATTH